MTLSPFLCGYRKGFSSQYSLLSFIEQFKMALNKKNSFNGRIKSIWYKNMSC